MNGARRAYTPSFSISYMEVLIRLIALSVSRWVPVCTRRWVCSSRGKQRGSVRKGFCRGSSLGRREDRRTSSFFLELVLGLMKVRLTPDSLRYRLDKNDTEILSTTGTVDFFLSLGSDRAIRCALKVSEEVRSLTVASQNGEIVVTLPVDQAEAWLSTDEIGLEEHVQSEGQRVQVLVEKDLGCRHGDGANDRSTSEAETFDHLRD